MFYDSLSGTPKERAEQFLAGLTDELDEAVTASDIFRVRDAAAALREHRDDVVAALTGSDAAKYDDTTTGGARQAEMAGAGRPDRR